MREFELKKMGMSCKCEPDKLETKLTVDQARELIEEFAIFDTN